MLYDFALRRAGGCLPDSAGWTGYPRQPVLPINPDIDVMGQKEDTARAQKRTAQRPESVMTLGSSQIAAAALASKKATPSATIASPGQFDLIPKPLAGRSGSRVSLGRLGRSRLLPLSRPRQIG